MKFQTASRISGIKEYYFSVKNRELADIAAQRKASGSEPLISLGIGAPDRMPPASAIDAIREDVVKKDAHRYQNYKGLPELREALAAWYGRWYGVALDPATQIQPLMGSKEGILIASMAFLNEGDKALIPNPGYPTYTSATLLAGAIPVPFDLLPENDFYPDFDALEKTDLSGVRMMWLNYPNMPTGAPASRTLYEKAVDFGRRHNILICSDNPYSFIRNDRPLSIFQVPGAMDCCIEFNSLSKAHNMSGWRVGMVAGDAEIISTLLKVKSQMDSGMLRGVQKAAIAALSEGEDWYSGQNKEYFARQAVALKIMKAIGAQTREVSQGLFVWGRITPDNPLIAGYRMEKTLGERMSDKLLYEKGVFLTPGMVFGSTGNDYVRLSLCADVPALESVLERVKG